MMDCSSGIKSSCLACAKPWERRRGGGGGKAILHQQMQPLDQSKKLGEEENGLSCGFFPLTVLKDIKPRDLRI